VTQRTNNVRLPKTRGGVGLYLLLALMIWGLVKVPLFGAETKATPRKTDAAGLKDVTPQDLAGLRDKLSNQLPANLSPEQVMASLSAENLKGLAEQQLRSLSTEEMLALIPKAEIERLTARAVSGLSADQILSGIPQERMIQLVERYIRGLSAERLKGLLFDPSGQPTALARRLMELAPQLQSRVAAGPAPAAPQPPKASANGADAVGTDGGSPLKPGAVATSTSKDGNDSSGSSGSQGSGGGGKDDDSSSPAAQANRAPVAIGDSASTTSGKSVRLTARGTDEDGDTLSFKLGSLPPRSAGTVSGLSCNDGRNGSLSCSGTFTPNPSFKGTLRLTFKVSDGKATSNEASVTVNVS
jgi:hypothetical protein